MNTTGRHFSDEANEVVELERKAKAVILYDNLDTLLAANEILVRVQSNEGGCTDWLVHSWRFDMLMLKHRLEAYRAMEESADAELMVIAIGDPAAWGRLPVDWLGLWWDYRRSPAARLIVMPFGSARRGAADAPVTGALRRLTGARALPFSVSCGVAPDEDALGNFRTPAAAVAGFSGSPGVKKRLGLRETRLPATCPNPSVIS